MDPVRTYDYLIQSRRRIFDSVRGLTPLQYLHRFPFGLQTIGSTITHLMISEWYYMERFEGRTVPSYERWPIQYENPPAFDAVERTWTDQMQRVRAKIAAERDWTRTIAYDSFPDDAGRRFHISATAGDFMTQLALHEVHHRSQIMVMLRELAVGPDGGHVRPVQDIDYNDLMYNRREIRPGE